MSQVLNCGFGFASASIGSSSTVTGAGTPPKMPVWTGANTLGDSQVSDNGTTVFIGTSATSSSAMFEVKSTTQGALFPRMTTTQRDAIPVGATEDSLFIYNTTSQKFNYYDTVAGAWITVESSIIGGETWAETLTNGAISGGVSPQMSNGDVIKAVNGGGQLNLRDGADGQASLTSDNGGFTQSWFYATPTASSFGFGANNTIIQNATSTTINRTDANPISINSAGGINILDSGANITINQSGVGNLVMGTALGLWSLTGAGSGVISATTGVTISSSGNNVIIQNNARSVGMGTSSPSTSAKLDITSTTQGMLTPRMTSAQRIAIGTPATGLLVYQTDGTSGFYYYNGSAWVLVQAGTSGNGIYSGSDTLSSGVTTVTYGVADSLVLSKAVGFGNILTATNGTDSSVMNATNMGVSDGTSLLGIAMDITQSGIAYTDGNIANQTKQLLVFQEPTVAFATETITLPVDKSGTVALTSDLSGFVTSVNGTANRISISGASTTPIVDIASTYVGQSSIITLGIITTGTWNGSTISETNGGTGTQTYTTGNILYSSATDVLSKLAIGSAGTFLRSNSTVPEWSGVSLPNSATTGDLLYASSTNNYDNLSVGTNGQILTLVGGVPTWSSPSADLNGIYSGSGSLSGVTTVTMATNNLNFSSTADANLLKIDSINSRIGIGESSPTAKLNIVGNGSTSSTSSFLVENSSLTELFRVYDDGQVTSRYAYQVNDVDFLTARCDGDNGNTVRGNILIGSNQATGITIGAGGNRGLYNIGIGTQAITLMTEGYRNVGIGFQTLLNVTLGHRNIAIGDSTLSSLNGTTDSNETFNTAVGSNSYGNLTTGAYHVGLGASAGTLVTSGNGNICLGALSGASVSGAYSHSIAIGRGAVFNASNQMVVGQQSSGANVNTVIWGSGISQNSINPTTHTHAITSISAGVTDISSDYSWVFKSSAGTGTGTGGDFIFQVAPSGVTGTAQNSFVEAMRITQGNNIGIGASSPNASSKLEIASTTQGFLTPRMTSAQRGAIGTPATGLLVYQTDGTAGFYYYNGSAWVLVQAGTSGNGIYSGSGTVPTTTVSTLTDTFTFFTGGGANLLFIDGNNERIGINVGSPTAKLHLVGGTASASSSPLKFTTGTLNTTAETGAMEFASDFFYLTANAVRTAISTFGRRVDSIATFTALVTDRIIGVTRTTTGTALINLPSAALYPSGYQITIMDEGLNASTNNITIDASGTQTINGSLTAIINVSGDSRTIYSNGVDAWFIM
jgi:trimeric autotransporter adhesin